MKKADQDRKRKATAEAKSRQQSKYSQADETQATRKAYSRHDSGTIPDEVTEDVSPHYLAELCDGYRSVKTLKNTLEIKEKVNRGEKNGASVL